MKKKSLFFLMILFVTILAVFSPQSVAAKRNASKGINILKTFPDRNVYQAVLDFDKNNDGYLSKKEIKQARKLEIHNEAISGCAEDIDKKLLNKTLNYSGLEYLTEIQEIKVDYNVRQADLEKSPFVKAKSISISAYTASKLDFSPCKNLQNLNCEAEAAKTVNLQSNNKIKNVSFAGNNISSIKLAKGTSLNGLELSLALGNTKATPGKVELTGAKSIKKLSVKGNAAHRLNVKNCDVNNIKIYESELSSLRVSNKKSIKQMDLDGTVILLKGLKQYSNLKSLSYREKKELSNDLAGKKEYQVFEGDSFPNLQNLYLEGSGIGGISADTVSKQGKKFQSSIQELRVVNTGIALKEISCLSGLQCLSYTMSDEMVKEQMEQGEMQLFDGNNYPEIDTLSIKGNMIYTNFQAMQYLRELSMAVPTGVTVPQFNVLPELEELSLSGDGIVTLDLSGCTSLKSVFFEHCTSIGELNLTGISDIRSVFGWDEKNQKSICNSIANNPIRKIILSQSASNEDRQYLQTETAKYDWSEQLKKNPGMNTTVEYVYVP